MNYEEIDWNKEQIVFIFGAGASASEGGPLSNDLLPESFKKFKNDARVKNVKEYIRDVYHNNCDDNSNIPNFEEILGPIDIALQKQEHISSKWNNEKLAILRNDLIYCICKILEKTLEHNHKYHANFIDDLLGKHYKRWNKCNFINLNYDILLDNALTKLGDKYKIDGHENEYKIDLDYGIRFRNETELEIIEDKDLSEMWHPPGKIKVHLLKLHGSLNWLYCPTCNSIKITPKKKGVMKIFTEFLLCESDSSEQRPLIVPPAFIKAYDNPYLVSIWLQAERILQKASRVYFIGYSMPEADIQIQYLLKKSLFRENSSSPKIIVVDRENNSENNDVHKRYKRLFGDIEYLPIGFENLSSHLNNIRNGMRESIGQNINTGRAGNDFGHRMGKFAAKHLETQLIDDASIKSNEACLSGEKVVIKSAHKKTKQIGVPHNVLGRVNKVIAVLEDKIDYRDGIHKYSIYKIDSEWFKSTMTPSQSDDYAIKKVGMVSCSKIKRSGEKIGEFTCDF